MQSINNIILQRLNKGASSEEAVDLLAQLSNIPFDKKQELLESNNLHGTGCNLSSAIVANLEKGNSLINSCLKSFDYVYEAIKNGNYGTLIAKL